MMGPHTELAVASAKYVASTALTLGGLGFIIYGVAIGAAPLSGHPAIHYTILVFVLILLGYLEGLQVAILALESRDREEWRETHPRAYALHALVTRGHNVQRFLVGRQFYVIFVVFLCSQVTTFPSIERPESVPYALWFAFIETGLPGALLVLAFGQLMPQLIASNHAVLFCNLRGAMFVLRMTLILEALGLTHFSWLLTWIVSKVTGIDKHSPDSSHASDVEKGWANSKFPMEQVLDKYAKIQGDWKRTALHEELQKLSAPLAPSFNPVATEMAEGGMQPAGTADPASLDGYKATPKSDVYPTPQDIAAYLSGCGQDVPCFLLPPSHKDHVPPHIVAFALMAGLTEEKVRSNSPKLSPSEPVGLLPPLEFLPQSVDLDKLARFRSDYRAFRLGCAKGAEGEVGAVPVPRA